MAVKQAGQIVLTPFPVSLYLSLLVGSIGNIGNDRLERVRQRLADWIAAAS